MPNSPVATDLPASAIIIPFPGSSAAPEPVNPAGQAPGEAELPGERLTRALAMLQAAQAEQRLALSSWRQAIEALSTSAASLNRSLETYQDSVRNLRSV